MKIEPQESYPIDSDWSDAGPIVYGLHGEDGRIVYVGATRNPMRRFKVYSRSGKCHNLSLGEWLGLQDRVYVCVLHVGVDGLFDAERREIAARYGLFNLVGGGDQAWRKHVSKPWMGGTGILCPSAIALSEMAKLDWPCHAAIKAISDERRKNMTDVQRIKYEVNIGCKLAHMTKVKRWIDVTADKMIAALEAENASG